MGILSQYKNTSYKLRFIHLIKGMMNDDVLNPIALAMKESFDDQYFILCNENYLVFAESKEKYENGEFEHAILSYKMRQFLWEFNRDEKVNTMIMCLSEIPGKENELMLHRFEENWKSVYLWRG